MKKLSLLIIASLTLWFVSCVGPYKEDKFEEIEPNETAFVVPLEAGTEDQKQFGSEKYLMEKKVATKRVYIPQKQYDTGRGWWHYIWIPTVRVIKVDRAPVTREWTDSKATGTKSKKQDIEVESKESIGFGIGVTVTASIPEEWAAKFLYNYNGRALSAVIDYNIRSFVQDLLTGEFGDRDLSGCQNDRKAVFEIMMRKTTEFFAKKGIRIDNIGAAGEFAYKETAIQKAINAKFTAEMKVQAAQDEVKAANKFAEARSAIESQKKLDAQINLTNAQADFYRGVAKGKVKLPYYYAPGSSDGLIPGLLLKK